ncbi:uncharacterized protein EV154DRAFT_598958 [Mucor mucedo]|uniref:uncharacterized protein n=1 Tax=Mucor mucedo TaxID=29922 RepID=UPI00221F7689|nr:uncharacterized protein EV154DRAFT_598958 [Mucor mucedo]KAI7895665.1 hypothetical protein EV154DRAFT_598958 [Mucor mucedo]
MNSKKFSRSKKSDGSNLPNFVFNFNGSQPGSPLASPGGFGSNSNPASPASSSFNFGTNTSQSFVFGDPATTPSAAATASPTTNTPFSFSSPQSNKRVQSQLELGASERDTFRRTASDNNLATPTNATPTNLGSFTFGAAPVKSSLSSQVSFGSTDFSIGATPASTTATTNPTNTPFSIAASSTPTITTVAEPTSAFGSAGTSKPFTFGSPAPTSTAVSTATSTPLFGASPLTADKPASGNTLPSSSAASAVPTTAPTGGFSFGSPASTTATSAPKPASAGFSFSAPASDTAEKIPSTTFSFGTAPSDAAKPATPASVSPFGASTATKSNEIPATSAASTPSNNSFSFNTPKVTVSTPTTSTSSSSPFTFGAPSSTASPTPATSTTTSAAATTTTSTTATTSAAAPTSSLFSLGTLTGEKDKKAGTVTSAPFTFGGSTTASTAPAATTSIPAIDPNKPNPFSFSKILDELAQTAAQPPNQIYASLITPSVNALQQNQIVSHTNFRIDNILSTTRFTELPEQAQKELDELEKYVRLEGQRCEYIGNHKVPQHVNVMNKAKKDTESLSQQLDAFSSTLKGQVESIASLYENVKTQLRHANEGCAVIEACKHPGNNARWLFGYSEYDNYFSLLAKQLGGRLEEYKKCIWEIERTAESWSHNRVQSPQDIADIMRAQNQAFLALSNKVAALHESVNVELHYYNQYLKMYS